MSDLLLLMAEVCPHFKSIFHILRYLFSTKNTGSVVLIHIKMPVVKFCTQLWLK